MNVMPFWEIDKWLLHLLNVDWGNPAMDQIWMAISHLERQMWFVTMAVPAIFVLFFYIYRLHAFKVIFVLGITVALSDLISYRLVKVWVNRLRPFENPEVMGWVRHVGDAHGPSFPSNHAVNCFAAATVLSWYFASSRQLFYIIALIVGVSRISLGVHFPSDVAGGAILGIFVGLLVKVLLLHHIPYFHLPKSVSSSDVESSGWRRRIRRLEQD